MRVGTSGYNYPEWRGHFYPTDLPQKAMLAYYAERFGTVEINASFYRMPTEATVASWAAATPARFVFTLKAPQRITHLKRLIDVDDPARRFADVAATLGPKLGPLFFQLPPTFKKETARLAALLALLPPGLRVALEFRHASWFADDVYDVLRARDAALCIADTDAGTTPDVATASWGYLRLRDAGYTDDELDRWAASVQRPEWRDAYVYFKHEAEARGPELAKRLLARVSANALL
ncbi:MAG: DUF72 domain-containing protein [Candidatus Rokubacteria bacterium]|nr:DUF72 domain-containing protein [Candidatus Rokubacteria bacterium]